MQANPNPSHQTPIISTILPRAILITCIIATIITITSCRNQPNNHCIPAQHPASGSAAPVLLFIGTGTSPCDVVAFQDILDAGHISYATANSAQLNSMSVAQLQQYHLLIMPGGNFIDMGKSLTTATAGNIREAVYGGLNYFGACAGAFLAGRSGYYNGFNLTENVTFGFYSAAAAGQSKAAVAITFAGGQTQTHYWENGPQLSGWGHTIGKYPDGTPAIAQNTYGTGNIILTGIHTEAPQYWRGSMNFNTTAADDNAYTATLILAAMNHVALPHY